MRTKKGLGLTILSLVMAIAMVFSITSMVNTVKADNAPTVAMQNGASIRVKADDPALIYTATVDNYDAEKEYGMILVENALLSGVTDYIAELDEANYQKIACAPYEDKGEHKITARFDVAMDKLSVDYAGIAYVKDGDAYTYSNVTANNVRSVEYVASMAYLRGDGNEAILASFMPSTEGLTFGAQADVPNNEAIIVEDNTHLEIVVDNLNEAIESYDGSTVLSFMSKDAYLPGSKVSFDILVPAELTGNYWVKFGTTTSKNSVDFYGGPDVVGYVPGAWTNVTCEIPSEGEDTYYFYITANKGGWHNEDESVLYPLCIDNVVVLEPTGDKFVQDFENGYKGGDSASVVNFVANGNEAKGIEVEDVVRTVFVPGKVTLGDPAPEASAKVYIDKIKSDAGLATFVTKEAYPAGAKVSFDYLVPADVTSAWFAVLCTPTQNQTDVYTDWAWNGNLVKGSWQKLELTLEKAGHLSIAGAVGDWGAKDSPVTEGYVLIDNFTVTVNGESVTDNFTKGTNAGLFDVYTEGAVELGEGYVKEEFVEANYSAKIIVDRLRSDVGLASFITKNSYPAGSVVSFDYLVPSDVTSSWFAVCALADPSKSDIYSNWIGGSAVSLAKGSWQTVTLTLTDGGYVHFAGAVGDWGGKDNPKTEGYILIDNFTVKSGDTTVVETFDKGIDRDGEYSGCLLSVNTAGAVELGEGREVPKVDENTELAMKYNFNVTEAPSVTKKAYAGGSTVSFKYYIPEGTTTGGWWGIAWNTVAEHANNYHAAGVETHYEGHHELSEVTGAWTDVSFTLPAEGSYYLYFGSDVGNNWKVDGVNSYALIDNFTVGEEVTTFTGCTENPIFNVTDGALTFGEGYTGFKEAEYSVKYKLNVNDVISFYTKKSYPAETTVSFKYFIPEGTTTQWWGWATAASIAGADYYAVASNSVGNTVGEWTTATFTTVSEGYIYIGFECGNWKLDGEAPYILLDDFVIGAEAESFNKGIDRAGEYSGCLFVTDSSVCSLHEEVKEEPEIPEEPEVPEITFESLEAEGKLHEYLAEEGRVFFGKDVELSDSALALSVRFDISYDGERSFALVLSDSAFIYFDGAKTCLYKDGACVLQLSAMTKVDIGVKANGEINLLMGDQYVCLSVVEIESVRFVSLFGEGTVTIEGLEVVIY